MLSDYPIRVTLYQYCSRTGISCLLRNFWLWTLISYRWLLSELKFISIAGPLVSSNCALITIVRRPQGPWDYITRLFAVLRKIHTNFCKSRTHFLAFTVPGIQLLKLSALDYSFVSSDKLRLQIRTILLSTKCKTSRLLICDLILLLDRLFLREIFNWLYYTSLFNSYRLKTIH